MAIVHLPSGLAEHTGGIDTIAIDAPRVHELLIALGERFPSLLEPLKGMAVAIDGQIFHYIGYEPLKRDSEIYFLPPISGG